MRIALATDWFAPRRGGIESQLAELAERLGRAGHEVDVLTSTPGAADGTSYHVRRLDVLRMPWTDVAISPRLPAAIAGALRARYDVIHAHVSVVSPVGYTAATAARLLGLPTVVTFHSVLRAKRHVLRALHSTLRIGDSGVVWSAVSETVSRQVQNVLDAEVRVLANGVDLPYWQTYLPKRQTHPAGTTTIVSATRLHPKKRPLALVRAFLSAAKRASLPARLLIAGEGPERPALEHEIQRSNHQTPGTVELLGWCDRDSLRALYAAAHGFVLASRREAFGIAALEARAAGLPVIAMNESGSREFLRHDVNALLCDDDVDLERQIARFLADAALRQRLAAARSPLERYDWSAVLAAHEQAYERAMTRAVAAPAAPASA